MENHFVARFETTSSKEILQSKKYLRSGMTDSVRSEIGVRLERQMTYNHDFLDPNLKLSELAHRLGTSQQLLSQYLNEVLCQSFYDYLHELRLKEFQRLVKDLRHRDKPLLELAYSSGFNSKTTFNSVFKKRWDVTPTVWKKNLNTR